jgi:hypothetical protein
MRRAWPKAQVSNMSGYDPDGIAQTEADYFEKCPVCSDWFDVRDVAQMALHIHDLTDVEIIIGRAAAPRGGPVQ